MKGLPNKRQRTVPVATDQMRWVGETDRIPEPENDGTSPDNGTGFAQPSDAYDEGVAAD